MAAIELGQCIAERNSHELHLTNASISKCVRWRFGFDRTQIRDVLANQVSWHVVL